MSEIQDQTDDWKWNDVGSLTKEQVREVGEEARRIVDDGGTARVIYEPGDSTRYDVLFSRSTDVLVCSTWADQPAPTLCGYYASLVNMGGAYDLGGGWKSWDYVHEHWSTRTRLGQQGAMALANLFNAFEGQL